MKYYKVVLLVSFPDCIFSVAKSSLGMRLGPSDPSLSVSAGLVNSLWDQWETHRFQCHNYTYTTLHNAPVKPSTLHEPAAIFSGNLESCSLTLVEPQSTCKQCSPSSSVQPHCFYHCNPEWLIYLFFDVILIFSLGLHFLYLFILVHHFLFIHGLLLGQAKITGVWFICNMEVKSERELLHSAGG